MVSMHTRIWAGALCLAAMGGLAACTAGDGSEASGREGATLTFEQIVADGLAQEPSDFQREVLTAAQESGTISEEDWKEANSREAACLTERGYPSEAVYEGADVQMMSEIGVEGGASESEAEASARRSAAFECYEQNSAFINEAYSLLNGGSVSLDPDEVQRAVLQCLVDRQLVPAETSYEEFVADLEQNEGKQFAPTEGENAEAVAACWMENS